MATPEDLYREILEQESRDDQRYRQNLAMREVKKITPKPIDTRTAKQRYEEEIRPVLEARQRVRTGHAPTRNPLVNLMLRITGRDKLPEIAPQDIVEPSKGLVIDGPTIADVQKAIAENPEAFRDLARTPEEVRKVDAKRRGVDEVRGMGGEP